MRRTRIGTTSLSTTLRSACLAGGLTLALAAGGLAAAATIPASAAAAPIALDVPGNGEPPLLAFDTVSGTTYVAWNSPVGSGIELCVLPSGTTGCEGEGPVLLTDSHFTGAATPVIGGLVVLPNGEAVVIGATAQAGVGSLAWASPADGAAFLSVSQGLQNGGEPISPVSLFYTVGNAAALDNTDVGLLDDFDHSYSFFSDSPFAGPESPAISATGNSNPGGLYPTKGQNTNGPDIAAEPAPSPAPAGTDVVVGVGDNYGGPSEPLPGCLNKEGTGYGVSVGKVDGTSKSSGTLNAEGLPAYGVLACSALAPVLAQGGTDGIGALEEEGNGIDGAGSDYQLDYHPFVATATGGSFGPGVELADVTNEVLDGVDAVDVSDDTGTGVYAFWEDGNTVLDYSPNGGATWEGPVASPIPYTAHGVIAGVGDGAALIAYDENPGTGNQVFLQLVSYQALAAAAAAGKGSSSTIPSAPAPTTLTTTQASGTTKGADISISAGTVGESDTATITGTNATSASGTVDFALYDNSSCSGTPTFAGAATAAGGVASIADDSSSGLSPGKYYWKAVYAGNATNDASTSTCGSEVLTVTPAATIEGKGESTSTTVTLTITCASTPCTVTITITVPSSSGKASSARKSKKHPKTTIVTLGTGTFTITTKGPHKLTVRLSKAGKKLLATDHGHLSAKILVAEKTPGGTILTTRTIELVPGKVKHNKK